MATNKVVQGCAEVGQRIQAGAESEYGEGCGQAKDQDTVGLGERVEVENYHNPSVDQ